MSHKQTAKFISRLCENLPEMDDDIMQCWIENPKGLKRFLLGLCPSENTLASAFHAKVWKTIKLGTGPKTGNDFKKAIKDAGMRISDYANDILGKSAFKVSETEHEVDLVNMSVAELGFKDGARYDRICAKAQELGLELCPAEVGPQLRLQYEGQPMNEWVIVAMEAITGSNGRLRVFRVVRSDDGTWLYGHYGDPDYVWNADSRFVFVRRK